MNKTAKYTATTKYIGNHGIDWKRELSEMKPEDWVAGVGEAVSGIADAMNNIEKYLPTGELQRGRDDAMDCATRSPHNDLETQFNYCIKNGLVSVRNIKWLYDQGYMDKNGSVALSDPFTAMMSGTTRNGNSLLSPLESIRVNGCIPKSMLPPPPNFTWAQYHNRNNITEEMIKLGLEFKRRFPVNYERVYDSQFATMKGVVGVAAFAWLPPVNGVYLRNNNPANHAFIIYKSPTPYRAFDNYPDSYDGDWIKQLAVNYKFFPHGYRVILNENIVDEPEDNKKKTMKKEQLEKLYRLGFHREIDDGALPYLNHEQDFVISEIMKSNEWEKIDRILNWAKSDTLWRLFMPADIKGAVDYLRTLDK